MISPIDENVKSHLNLPTFIWRMLLIPLRLSGRMITFGSQQRVLMAALISAPIPAIFPFNCTPPVCLT